MEYFVDFETITGLADTFRKLPATDATPLIFQIGCGHWVKRGTGPADPLYGMPTDGNDPDRRWVFWQRTVTGLSEEFEARMIDDWVTHMTSPLSRANVGWDQARLIHWSGAEVSFLESAYNSARVRQQTRNQDLDHPSYGGDRTGGNLAGTGKDEGDWPNLPWFDLLELVIRKEPVTVRGAYGFGLKAVAKALHAAGLIETSWKDGPADGLGAMIGAFVAAKEATALGIPLFETQMALEIGRYNGVDVRVMSEILTLLRNTR